MQRQSLSSAARWRRQTLTQGTAHNLQRLAFVTHAGSQSSPKPTPSSASWAWEPKSHLLTFFTFCRNPSGPGASCSSLRPPRTPLRHGQLSQQCSAGQSGGAGAGPSRSCQAVAWIWSRPLPGPCSEPFPDGFSFTHVAVAQCQEAAAPQDRRHQWCSTSCGASSARAAQWGAGCCPAPACLAARDYLASCGGQGPTPRPTWLSPDSALVTDHGDQPQPPTSPLARRQQR